MNRAQLTTLADLEAGVRAMPAKVAALRPVPAETSPLRALWIAAADTAERFSEVAADAEATDEEFNLAERAAFGAEQALRDYLLDAEGLTSADLRRSVL